MTFVLINEDTPAQSISDLRRIKVLLDGLYVNDVRSIVSPSLSMVELIKAYINIFSNQELMVP